VAPGAYLDLLPCVCLAGEMVRVASWVRLQAARDTTQDNTKGEKNEMRRRMS